MVSSADNKLVIEYSKTAYKKNSLSYGQQVYLNGAKLQGVKRIEVNRDPHGIDLPTVVIEIMCNEIEVAEK